MKHYEKAGYESAQEATRYEECPGNEMTEYCVMNACEDCWNREVEE